MSKALLASLVLVLAGCANHVYSVSYSPITKEYANKLDNVNLGMTKPQVRQVFPDLVTRGQIQVSGRQVEALELSHNYWAGVGGRLVEDQLWFYFVDGKLARWGRPNDWPSSQEVVIRAPS